MSDQGEVQYHSPSSCNRCGGENDVEATDSTGSYLLECRTECKDCGFKDYWAHGWYESGQTMESNCETYSFHEINQRDMEGEV